ncbi:hypothetical protein GS399_12115 [Pedobacter sp. HMF7647]|uniref:Lipopolysaccharide biosynthesis protein n=1 Tax=Hufsiella arboris TaxID=2695275 RepID=A0A7K1YBA8_9SPHI|nr:hypothetical protein [Hufsiella arboris]MXV51720.1 hypothetical protein [Hufsiella arboris]
MAENESKTPPYIYSEEDNFSWKETIKRRREDSLYLWKNRSKILIALIIGALSGALTSWLWPVTYTARLTFVVEDPKGMSGGSMVSALAGSLGFDMGSIGNTSGLLAGDNVLELVKSEKLIKGSLLTPYKEKKTDYTLADRYSEVYKLKKKWQEKYLAGKSLSFPADQSGYSRLQDSLLQVMVKQVKEKELSISKPDKKLTFFELNITTRDERVSQLLCERLLKSSADFYISNKTAKLKKNVDGLQKRADSLARLLNRKTYSASAASGALLDLNPAYTTANVSSELQERDKVTLSTIYSEVIKNLEVSKTMLVQETPAFQMVDEPELPLKKNRFGYGKGIALGVFLFAVFYCSIALLKRSMDQN